MQRMCDESITQGDPLKSAHTSKVMKRLFLVKLFLVYFNVWFSGTHSCIVVRVWNKKKEYFGRWQAMGTWFLELKERENSACFKL